MENASRVTSPISTDGMAEELILWMVLQASIPNPDGSRSHEPLSVDSVSNSLPCRETGGGHGGVDTHSWNGLELPVAAETDHIVKSGFNVMSD